MLSKFLEFIKSKQSEIVLALAVVLIAIISFQSGRISALRHPQEPLKIVDSSSPSLKSQIGTESQKASSVSASEQVVASKNSTVYHFTWCSGAKKIKEENKVTFSSEQEAKSRGYTLAFNCHK